MQWSKYVYKYRRIKRLWLEMKNDIFEDVKMVFQQSATARIDKLQVLWRRRRPGKDREKCGGHLGMPRHDRRANLTLCETSDVGTFVCGATVVYRAGHSDHHRDAHFFRRLVGFFVGVWRFLVGTPCWSPLWESKSGKDVVGRHGTTTSSFDIRVWGRICSRITSFRVRRFFGWSSPQHCG